MSVCGMMRSVDIIHQAGSILRGSLVQARALHNTHTSADFFSWFKKKKAEESEPIVPTKPTDELIKDIESGKKTKPAINSQRLSLTKENFIGKEPGFLDRTVRQKLISEIPFNKWTSDKTALTERRLEEILVESYNDSFPGNKITTASNGSLDAKFSDLVTKFHFTKLLQAKSGYLIPDYKLTVLNSPSQFKKYYLDEIVSGRQARFKESEPNAIHLTQEKFTSPNIYVVPDVNVKSQNKNYRKIMKEVNLAEVEVSRRTMEQVANS